MPERQVAKNLQLDEATGRSSAHLELQDTGRPADSRWQLRNDSMAGDWQPVEYARPSQSEPSWILPSLVGLVLIGVAGYMIYIGLNRLSSLDVASVPAEVAPAADSGQVTVADPNAPVASAVEQEATSTPLPTEEPTATTAPTEEPTVQPTAVLVEQQIATIANQFGVNARLEPSTSGDVLRILEEGETVVILDELASDEIDGNWLQVRTSEDATVWISSQFVDIETQVVPGEASAVSSNVPDLDVRVTISSPAGLNARAEPDSASEIVTLLPDDTSYPAVSQSADGQWIEVALEDGTTAWIFLQLVIPDTDLATLPIFQAAAVAGEGTVAEPANTGEDEVVADEPVDEDIAATDTITETVAVADEPVDEDIAATETLTDTAAIEEEPTDEETATGPTPLGTSAIVSITNEFGVNARSTTSTDGEILVVLEPGSAPVLRGRNDDGSWLQVVLEDGTLAWVFAQAVEAPENIDELPVFAPPAVGDPAETLDSAESATPEEIGAEEGATDEAAAEETATEETATEETATEETATEETATEETATEETAEEGATAEETGTAETDAEDVGSDESAETDDVATATATISTFLGAKARPAPTTEQEEIDTVPFNQELTAIGRSDDSEWVQVELFEDQIAWILLTKVDLSVPVEELPATE